MARPAVNPIPEGMHSRTPASGLPRRKRGRSVLPRSLWHGRSVSPDRLWGKLAHATVRIGTSLLMLVDEALPMGALSPQTIGGSPVTIHLSVADAAATMRQAEAAGATVKMAVTDLFWGALYGVLEDPFGHSRSVATQVRELSPQAIETAMHAPFGMPGEATCT